MVLPRTRLDLGYLILPLLFSGLACGDDDNPGEGLGVFEGSTASRLGQASIWGSYTSCLNGFCAGWTRYFELCDNGSFLYQVISSASNDDDNPFDDLNESWIDFASAGEYVGGQWRVEGDKVHLDHQDPSEMDFVFDRGEVMTGSVIADNTEVLFTVKFEASRCPRTTAGQDPGGQDPGPGQNPGGQGSGGS